MTELYFEDFAPGQIFPCAETVTVSKDDIIAFAKQFDPQPFHLSEEGGKNSIFGRMVASGWHTGCLSMRLKLMSDMKSAGGMIGLSVTDLTWPQPVLPGDTLRGEMEILETTPSTSNPARGKVRYEMRTYNQNDELVFSAKILTIVPRRDTA